jgi:hypothetical protein
MREIALTPAQIRMLTAIVEERERFLRESDAALDELARMVAAVNMVATEGQKLAFYQESPNAPIVVRVGTEEAQECLENAR